jgi:hypothetical protein
MVTAPERLSVWVFPPAKAGADNRASISAKPKKRFICISSKCLAILSDAVGINEITLWLASVEP